MKIALYLWIVVVTFLFLFSPPMRERPTFAEGSHWISVEPLQEGIFYAGRRPGQSEVQVDFLRLIACLLAINFIPAVLLLKWDQVTAFSKRNKGILITVAVALALLCVVGIFSSIQRQQEAERQKQISEAKARQEANAAAANAARAGLPPGFHLVTNKPGLFDDLIPPKKPTP